MPLVDVAELGITEVDVTEIVRESQVEAYRRVAADMCGQMVVTEVAGPGNAIFVARKLPIMIAGIRVPNSRDLGRLVGVNLENIPTSDGPRLTEHMVPEQHRAVLLRPSGNLLRYGAVQAFYSAASAAQRLLWLDQQAARADSQ